EKIMKTKSLIKVLSILVRFSFDHRLLWDLRKTFVAIGVLPTRNVINLRRATRSLPVFLYTENLNEKQSTCFLVTTSVHAKVIMDVLKAHAFEQLHGLKDISSPPKQALCDSKKELEQLEEEKRDAVERINEFRRQYRVQLLAYDEMLADLQVKLKAKIKMTKTRQTAKICGFVPVEAFPELKDKIREEFGQRVLIFTNKKEDTDDLIPSIMSNKRIFKPFEILTRLYGLPAYNEIDPTAILAITFPLVFGLMFGDLGHGIVVLIAGAVISTRFKNRSSLHNFGKIMISCGIGATIAGVLFGEAFGFSIFPPLWFDPFENIIQFLEFNIYLGLGQITIGLTLKFIDYVIQNRKIDAVTIALPEIIFYFIIAFSFLFYHLDFNQWLSGPLAFIVVVIGIILVAKPISLLFIKQASVSKIIGEHLLNTMEFLLSFMSNTMSYVRILALLMAHWALLRAIYAISGLIAGIPWIGLFFEIAVVILGNIVVVAFEGTIVFIHTMRLHYYEWFSKFYHGSGYAFIPFKHVYRYADLHFSSL
ncbi:MAG: V-type ATP synthase subunit I, partial [Candidatus Ranarchaeia archaeon]